MSEGAKFDTFAILEIMGHQRYAGRVSEQMVAGAMLVRVDVPDVVDEGKRVPGFTKFFGGQSIFCITPCDEDTARIATLNFRSRPFESFRIVVPQQHPSLVFDPEDRDERDPHEFEKDGE